MSPAPEELAKGWFSQGRAGQLKLGPGKAKYSMLGPVCTKDEPSTSKLSLLGPEYMLLCILDPPKLLVTQGSLQRHPPLSTTNLFVSFNLPLFVENRMLLCYLS